MRKQTLFLFIVFLIPHSLIFGKSSDELIQESIANYPGKCPCPYSIMSNGKKCGKRSAYSKPGGRQPLCYVSDIPESINKNNKQLRVIDGDTINYNGNKYRLHGIDAPETAQICKIDNQPYHCGVKATNFLKSLITERSKFSCKKKGVDRYKRIIAVCYLNKKDLNKLMVRNGWAIAYREYSKDYIQDEDYAKKNKFGIWKGSFIKPQKWRRLN